MWVLCVSISVFRLCKMGIVKKDCVSCVLGVAVVE